MTDRMREEFEAWAITCAWLGLSDECMARDEINGGYYGLELHAAWLAWQASRAVPVERPEDFTDGGNPNARILIAHHRQIVGRWVSAIEAAGLKVKP